MNKKMKTIILFLLFITNTSECMMSTKKPKPSGLKKSLTINFRMLSKQFNETRKELKQTQKELDQEIKFRQTTDSKLANANAKILLQQNQLNQEVKYRQTTDSKLANAKAEILFQQNQITRIKSFIERQELINKTLQNEQNLCTANIENTAVELDILKENFYQCDKRIDKQDTQIEVLDTSFDDIQTNIEVVQDSVAAVRETIDELEDKVSDLQNTSPCQCKKRSRSSSPYQAQLHTRQYSPPREYTYFNDKNDNHTTLSVGTGITTSPTKSNLDLNSYTPKSPTKETKELPNNPNQTTACSLFQAIFKKQISK
jgi:chromosome segregation ATPase